MNLFNRIKTALLGNSKSIETPDEFCPNCWGRQEYGGKVYDAIKTEDINLKNIDKKKGWIEAYSIQRLEGIKLQKRNDSSTVCPTCKLSFRPQ